MKLMIPKSDVTSGIIEINIFLYKYLLHMDINGYVISLENN